MGAPFGILESRLDAHLAQRLRRFLGILGSGCRAPARGFYEPVRHIQFAVGRLCDGAHVGILVDTHAGRQNTLAGSGGVAIGERCDDGRRVLINDERQRFDAFCEISGQPDTDRHGRGILGAVRSFKRDLAGAIEDFACTEDVASDAVPGCSVAGIGGIGGAVQAKTECERHSHGCGCLNDYVAHRFLVVFFLAE